MIEINQDTLVEQTKARLNMYRYAKRAEVISYTIGCLCLLSAGITGLTYMGQYGLKNGGVYLFIGLIFTIGTIFSLYVGYRLETVIYVAFKNEVLLWQEYNRAKRTSEEKADNNVLLEVLQKFENERQDTEIEMEKK